MEGYEIASLVQESDHNDATTMNGKRPRDNDAATASFDDATKSVSSEGAPLYQS
jgi:hypothetical protein